MQRVVAWLALGIAGAAMVVAVVGCFMSNADSLDESAAEERVYARIVKEVHAELVPVYRDFGIEVEEQPRNLREVLRPLLEIADGVDKAP
jgi:hypothetical protein